MSAIKRCMGPWPSCGHPEDTCTASPAYQARIKPMTTPDLTPSGGEPIAVEFRVTLPWRKVGCEGWRVSDAKKRLRLLEYDRLEVRYSDGRVETLPTPPDAITTDTQDDREALRERVLARGTWAGDSDVLDHGWPIEVLASDPLPAEVLNGHQLRRLPGRTACWIRCQPEGDRTPMYRSCDLCDLDISDEDFERLAALPLQENGNG